MAIIEKETSRLKLRQWLNSDSPIFATMNADPAVMEYYPNTLTEIESNAQADRFRNLIKKQGWGFWAVEELDNKKFIGFVGLHIPSYELPVTPCVEIGWRLVKECWGKGYATEAANASLSIAFEQLNLTEVYSFTSVTNIKSQAVMERLNMVNMQKNFEHPMLPVDHPLREHILYRIDAERWSMTKNS